RGHGGPPGLRGGGPVRGRRRRAGRPRRLAVPAVPGAAEAHADPRLRRRGRRRHVCPGRGVSAGGLTGGLPPWGTPDAPPKREESVPWRVSTTPVHGITSPCLPPTTPPLGSSASSPTAGSRACPRCPWTATR